MTKKTEYGYYPNFSHTFTPPAGVEEQTYLVKLSGRDNEGSTVTKTITIIVKGFVRQYYLTDHLGSIRTTVDGSGMNKGTMSSWDDYYPYGLPMPNRSFNATNPQALNKFTGHEHDVQNSINLTYAGARYLDPEIGQLVSVDPLAAKFPEWSPYNYTMGNPMNLVDPDGRESRAAQRQELRNMQLLSGEMSREEFMNEIKAEGEGGLIGVGLVSGGVSAFSTVIGVTMDFLLDDNKNAGGASAIATISSKFIGAGSKFGVKGTIIGAVLGEVVGGLTDRFVSEEEQSIEASTVDGIGGVTGGVFISGVSQGVAANGINRAINSSTQNVNGFAKSQDKILKRGADYVYDVFNSLISNSDESEN